MGQKLLILAACLIAGETVGQPAGVGETVEVSKDDASYLTRSGRAMYLDKADDPTKGLLTAAAEDKKRAAEQAKAAAAVAEASRAANTPMDMATVIANAVQAGVAAGLAAAAKTAAHP